MAFLHPLSKDPEGPLVATVTRLTGHGLLRKGINRSKSVERMQRFNVLARLIRVGKAQSLFLSRENASCHSHHSETNRSLR